MAEIIFRAVAIDGLDYTKIVFDEQLTTIVFLFTFFAYDSAKMQLKKTNLSK